MELTLIAGSWLLEDLMGKLDYKVMTSPKAICLFNKQMSFFISKWEVIVGSVFVCA